MSVPASPSASVELAKVASWQACRDEVAARLAPCVPRPETRQRLQAYLDGLLSDTRRKNSWQLAEAIGDATPYGFQHLLGRATWSVDQARDALYAYVGEYLGDAEGVIVINETSFPSRGPVRLGWRGSTAAGWAR